MIQAQRSYNTCNCYTCCFATMSTYHLSLKLTKRRRTQRLNSIRDPAVQGQCKLSHYHADLYLVPKKMRQAGRKGEENTQASEIVPRGNCSPPEGHLMRAGPRIRARTRRCRTGCGNRGEPLDGCPSSCGTGWGHREPGHPRRGCEID